MAPNPTRAKANARADGAQDYARHIANRVRGIRAQRGASRKLLAQHAGISERYLAQIESGQANLSIGMLWQIAQALDTTPELLLDNDSERPASDALGAFVAHLDDAQKHEALELLSAHFRVAADARRGVALVGLRGAGKSTLGSRLADRLGVPFVQLTDVIEKLANMAVAEVFSLGGQQTYRRLEREAVEQVRDAYSDLVLETGGSLVSASESYSFVRRYFFTVWVKARPEEHMQRVIAQGDIRPMAGNHSAMDDLRRILQEREAQYGAADYVLDTSNRDVDACLEELVSNVPALDRRTVESV